MNFIAQWIRKEKIQVQGLPSSAFLVVNFGANHLSSLSSEQRLSFCKTEITAFLSTSVRGSKV